MCGTERAGLGDGGEKTQDPPAHPVAPSARGSPPGRRRAGWEGDQLAFGEGRFGTIWGPGVGGTESQEGGAPQGAEPHVEAKRRHKTERTCFQHGGVTVTGGGKVRLTPRGLLWDFTPSPPKTTALGQREAPPSPMTSPSSWPVGRDRRWSDRVSSRHPEQALSYRLLLLFSIFLELSPSPRSLSC